MNIEIHIFHIRELAAWRSSLFLVRNRTISNLCFGANKSKPRVRVDNTTNDAEPSAESKPIPDTYAT